MGRGTKMMRDERGEGGDGDGGEEKESKCGIDRYARAPAPPPPWGLARCDAIDGTRSLPVSCVCVYASILP